MLDCMKLSFSKIKDIDLPLHLSQCYLRFCLLGYSPHFTPNKGWLTTLMLCEFIFLFSFFFFSGQVSDTISRKPKFSPVLLTK